MNKKGFTLIEMLLVVVLIGIISFITIPNVMDMLKEARVQETEEYEKTLIENLKLYRIDHKEDLVWNNNLVEIDFETLKSSNPDIKLADKCSVNNLKIIREEIDSLVSNSYNYTYQVCFTCDNKTYGSGC